MSGLDDHYQNGRRSDSIAVTRCDPCFHINGSLKKLVFYASKVGHAGGSWLELS